MPRTARTNRRIVLNQRPHGVPDADTLRLEEGAIPSPGPGQMLLRSVYLSLDPYMRGLFLGVCKVGAEGQIARNDFLLRLAIS